MAGDWLVSVGRVFVRGMEGRAAGRQQYGMHPVTWGASQIFGGFRLTGGDFSLVIEKDALYAQQFGIHPIQLGAAQIFGGYV